MNSRLEVFSKSLQTCGDVGIATYKECIFTKTLKNCMKNSESAGASVQKRLQSLFCQVFGISHLDIGTYMLKKSQFADRVECAFEGYKATSILDDVGGAPLELDDKIADLSLGTGGAPLASDSPLLDDDALISEDGLREILSFLHLLLCNQESAVILSNALPMLIFCTWEHQQPDPHGLMYITAQKNQDGKITALVEKRVVLSGPHASSMFTKDAALNSPLSNGTGKMHTSSKYHMPNVCITKLIKKHLVGSHPSRRPDVSLKSHGEFELFQASRTILHEEDMDLSFVKLCISCNKVGKILGIEQGHIREVTLDIAPVPGDMRGSAFHLYESIQVLEGLFCAFGESGRVGWTLVDVGMQKESSEGSANVSIVSKVKQVISAYNSEWMIVHKQRGPANEELKAKENVADEQTLRQMISPREELDFTETLWEVLQYAGSSEELATSFEVILKEVAEGRSTQFWLHRDNNTTLARWIRESYRGEVSSLPRLTDALCIQLLIELGLDKLTRDYTSFFISKRLANAARLQPYVGSARISQTLGDLRQSALALQTRFVLLKKLHHIAELAVQCKIFLCLSHEQTFSITRMALQSYLEEDLDFKKTFSFVVDYNEVENLIKNSLPSIWRLSLTSGHKGCQKVTNVCWNTQYPFRGVMSPPIPNINLAEATENHSSGMMLTDQDVADKYYISTQSTTIFAA